MIRLLILAVLALLAAYVAVQIVRQARSARLDWTGIAFAGGFVVMAFYLRHATGMGPVF